MPRFSIVVPAYKSEAYLEACMESVARQRFEDWELLVVVDGSPDASRAIAEARAAKDARVKVVNKERNEGIHRARVSGAQRATGDFVFFLDADDELHENCLEQMAEALAEKDCDILHVGIKVISVGVPEEECRTFESFINQEVEPLHGRQIAAAAYSAAEGFRQDWRFTQRAYRRELLQRAVALMTESRLGRNEDGYEYFVTACLAKSQVTRNDIVALDYYYGRGLNSSELLAGEAFVRTTAEFGACLDAISEFAAGFDGFATEELVAGSREKAIDLLFNDWRNRVSPSEQLAAAEGAAKVLGEKDVATQLVRLARDEAYAAWVGDLPLERARECARWYRLADALMQGSADPATRYGRYRAEARGHLMNLERRESPRELGAGEVVPVRSCEYERQSVRIFVTTHKDVELFESDVLQPVQVGPTPSRKRLLWAYQDDSGESIAERNPQYCELTTQYWAWKNVDAEVYGFCHYRRYFDFSEEAHEENAYGEVMEGYIGPEAQKRYGLDDASILRAVQDADVITTGVNDMRRFPEAYKCPADHYARAPHLFEEDLERVMSILVEAHPDYAEDVERFLGGHHACFCNMFVMRKELFQRYSAWLFPLLDTFVSSWDTSRYSHEGLRTPGHLAERLLNVFLLHERRTNPGLRWKQVQCVHFEHPERVVRPVARPLSRPGAQATVPVVLAADNNYVPMLATTIRSMLENASRECLLDIVVLEKDISERNERLLREGVMADFPNASLRLVDVSPYMGSRKLETSNDHISAETYYRFLIQEVMPGYDKVLYLDSDLIVEGDVCELYATELGDNLLAAALDVDFLGNLNLDKGERIAYASDVLRLADPYAYFQAGVLLLNLKGLRELCSTDEWLAMAAEGGYIYDDQDILNARCQGRVTFLENEWNVMIDCNGRIARIFSYAPAAVYDAFRRAYERPKIVHYAGFEKPWNPGGCDYGELYWSYARRTPFYEALLSRMSGAPSGVPAAARHERAIGERSPLRGVLDPVLPLGSRRRELLKAVARAARGRH